MQPGPQKAAPRRTCGPRQYVAVTVRAAAVALAPWVALAALGQAWLRTRSGPEPVPDPWTGAW